MLKHSVSFDILMKRQIWSRLDSANWHTFFQNTDNLPERGLTDANVLFENVEQRWPGINLSPVVSKRTFLVSGCSTAYATHYIYVQVKPANSFLVSVRV